MTAIDESPADFLAPGEKHEAQEDDTSRYYVHPETGDPYLSVTWVTGFCQSKPFLAPWAAKMAAQYAVDFQPAWQAVQRTEGRDAAVKLITRTSALNRALKAEVGTYEHDVVEALCLDTPLPGVPEQIEGRVVQVDDELVVIDQKWLDSIADGFLNFVTDFQARVVAAELTAASDEHQAAGTIDWIGYLTRLGPGVTGIDVKTGAHLGPEILAQLGPYKEFPDVWLRGGMIHPRPHVDQWAILHLRPSYARGYKLIVLTPAELALGWEWWQRCREQMESALEVPAKYGRVVYPARRDGSQPPPMVEDLRFYPGCSRAIKPLVDAGFVWLAELTMLERGDILAIKGVGPKTVDALEKLLSVSGLHLAERAA